MSGPVNVHRHRKTGIHALKSIFAVWKREVRYTPGDTNRASLYYKLITVLYSDISLDLSPMILDSYLEADFLAG